MQERRIGKRPIQTGTHSFFAPIGIVALCATLLGTAQAKEADHSGFADKVEAAMWKSDAASELFALRNEAPSQPARQFLVVASCAAAIRQGKMDLMRRFARTEFGETGPSRALKMLSRKCPQGLGIGEVQIPCATCKGSGKCSRCNGKGKVKVESTKTRNYLDKSHVDKDGHTISGRTAHGAKQILGDYDASNVWTKCPHCHGAGNMGGKCASCRGRGTVADVCPSCKGEKTVFDKDYAAGLVQEKLNVVKSKAKVAEIMLACARSSQMSDTNNAIEEATVQVIGAYGRQANPGGLGELYKFASKGDRAAGLVFAYCVLNGFASYEKLVKNNDQFDQLLIADCFSGIDPFAIDADHRRAAMQCLRDMMLMPLAGKVADFIASDLIPEHMNLKREAADACRKWTQTQEDYDKYSQRYDDCLRRYGNVIRHAQDEVAEQDLERALGRAFGGSGYRPVLESEKNARVVLGMVDGMKRETETAKGAMETAEKTYMAFMRREDKLLKSIRELAEYGSVVAKTYVETGRFIRIDEPPSALAQTERPEQEVGPLNFDFTVFSDEQACLALKLLGANIRETERAREICSRRNEEFASFIREHKPMVSEQDRQIAQNLQRKAESAVRNAETLVSRSKRLFQYIETAAQRGVAAAKTIVNNPVWSGSQSVSISVPSIADAEANGDAVLEQEERLMAAIRKLAATAIQSGEKVKKLNPEYFPVIYHQYADAFEWMSRAFDYFLARAQSKSASAHSGAQKRYLDYCKEIVNLKQPMIEFLKTSNE